MPAGYSLMRKLTPPTPRVRIEIIWQLTLGNSIPEAAAFASMKCHTATQGDIDYTVATFTYFL